MLISPYAKSNYVDNTLTEQSSILQFVEQNWSLGSIGAGSEDVDSGTVDNMFEFGNAQRAPKVILNEATGEVVSETPGENPAGGPEGPAGKEGAGRQGRATAGKARSRRPDRQRPARPDPPDRRGPPAPRPEG